MCPSQLLRHTKTHKSTSAKHMKETRVHTQIIAPRKQNDSKIISHEANIQNGSMHIYLGSYGSETSRRAHMHTRTHTHTHRPNLCHREASYVSIFSHCGSISLSACRPASCNTEGEKYAFIGQPRKTQDTALSFLFTLHCVILILLFQSARQHVYV